MSKLLGEKAYKAAKKQTMNELKSLKNVIIRSAKKRKSTNKEKKRMICPILKMDHCIGNNCFAFRETTGSVPSENPGWFRIGKLYICEALRGKEIPEEFILEHPWRSKRFS